MIKNFFKSKKNVVMSAVLAVLLIALVVCSIAVKGAPTRTCDSCGGEGVVESGERDGNLTEKGYNPINQIVGYLLTEDPTYITNYNNARSMICKIDRDELMQVLVREYLFEKE